MSCQQAEGKRRRGEAASSKINRGLKEAGLGRNTLASPLKREKKFREGEKESWTAFQISSISLAGGREEPCCTGGYGSSTTVI